jgi:hypothetical protein
VGSLLLGPHPPLKIVPACQSRVCLTGGG